MRKRFNFQTLWTSNIQRYSVNLQNFHGWLVTRSWQQNKIKSNMGNTRLQEQPSYPNPSSYWRHYHGGRSLTFVTAFSGIRSDFCIQILPPCPLSGSLLQPAKVTQPTSPPPKCLAIVQDMINIKCTHNHDE